MAREMAARPEAASTSGGPAGDDAMAAKALAMASSTGSASDPIGAAASTRASPALASAPSVSMAWGPLSRM